MPRNIRVFVPNSIYHVYCRVTRGERVFDQRALAENWVETLALIGEQHQLKILAWCLLPNHYHLVVQTGVEPLWRAMARFQGRVAKEHNRLRSVAGRFWQSRYRARIVTEQAYLNHLFAYVHLNPVAAGVVNDPADHPFSGHRAIIGTEIPRLLDIGAALEVFDPDPRNARRIYLASVRAVAEIKWLRLGVRHLPWWKKVSDDEQTLPEAEAPTKATMYDGRPLPPEEALRPPLFVVLASFEEWQGIPHGRLCGSTRTRLDGWHRCLFSTLAVIWLGYSSKEVAAVLGKDPSSVSRWLAEGLTLQARDSAVRRRLEDARRFIPETMPEFSEPGNALCQL